MIRKPIIAALAAFGLAAITAHAQTEVHFWHSMGGALGDKVSELAGKFNASQQDYRVVPTYKGSYPESMTAAIAAYRAGNAPHILQVFEVGTATMMAAKGAVVPVYKLMKDADEPFNPKAYIGPVAGYYTDSKGNMLSFPFNSSTAIFYWNKDAFKKAGLDPNKPPRTWSGLLMRNSLSMPPSPFSLVPMGTLCQAEKFSMCTHEGHVVVYAHCAPEALSLSAYSTSSFQVRGGLFGSSPAFLKASLFQ